MPAKRLHKLVLCSTGAKIGNPDTWVPRIDAVRKGGTKSIARDMERWFTGVSGNASPQTVERLSICGKHQPKVSSLLRSFARSRLPRKHSAIRTPTLVISGLTIRARRLLTANSWQANCRRPLCELDAPLIDIEQRDVSPGGV